MDVLDTVLIAACARIYSGLLFHRGFNIEEFEESLECLKKDFALKLERKKKK
jgi:hypothetical protein